MRTPIEVLVVDDSAFMRKAISMMLERASDITVVETAANGEEGVEKAVELAPDVVTMDVEMPKMNGITAVRRIMDAAPRPILMLSSLTEDGAEATLRAMRAGAADFIPKGHAHTSLQIKDVEEELIDKVRALARSESRHFREEASTKADGEPSAASTTSRSSARSLSGGPAPDLIVIGVSTGGPMALQHVVPALPAELPAPVAITQHMPPRFTRSLAERLDGLSALDVAEAAEGTPLQAGQAVVAAGGRHLTFRRRGAALRVQTPEEPADPAHRPSVDVMFRSACDATDGQVLAVVMTGMGKDGVQGARQVKDAGGRVIAQDEASSVVYGMPRAVAEAGLTDAVVPLEELADVIGEAAGAPALS